VPAVALHDDAVDKVRAMAVAADRLILLDHLNVTVATLKAM
jgi:hypothetical protein